MFFVSYSIEGYPVIIRFKTYFILPFGQTNYSIEGYPVIIRFKTSGFICPHLAFSSSGSIEGYPVIIRFKTPMHHQ